MGVPAVWNDGLSIACEVTRSTAETKTDDRNFIDKQKSLQIVAEAFRIWTEHLLTPEVAGTAMHAFLKHTCTTALPKLIHGLSSELAGF